MNRHFTIITLTILWSVYALAGIIQVSQDQPTIQAGINAAVNGDTVLVADGTYTENINFRGKAITVASHFLMDGDTTHIDSTIINGSMPNNPDSGSVVYFVSGEDTNSILCGFTVTGGTGTFVASGSPPLPPFNLRVGGGILIGTDVGARIIHNNINHNSVSTNYYASGGGIQSDMSGGTGYTIIENNTIRNNSVIGEISYTCGGAICIVSSGRITKNIISDNLVYSVNFDVVAGGIRIVQSPGTPVTSYCIVEENIIKNNQAVSDFGYAHAAGLNSSGINITLRNNTIINNTVSSNFDSWSAAMHIGNLDSSSRIENNRFSGNHSTRGTCFGGGLYIYNSYPFIIKNIIDNNSANYGGGIYLNANSQPHFINNTIVSNSATSSGGGIYSYQCDLLVENTIIWDNTASNGSQIYLSGATDEISYSDIQGGWPGTGNINLDPMLYDSTMSPGDTTYCCLHSNSPCVDAGNPHPNYNDLEDPNNPGFPLWPAMGTLRNDMGAHGGPHELVTGIIRNNDTTIPSRFYLSQNYPNPFNPTTTIEFALPQTGFVTLKIYNILGEEVATLISGKLAAGKYKYDWSRTGGMASGVYLYHLQTGNFVETRKMILMK